jgi:hypothetical protein
MSLASPNRAWTIVTAVLIGGFAAKPLPASDLKTWRLLSDSPPFPLALGVPMGVLDPLRNRVLALDLDLGSQPVEVHAFDLAQSRWSILQAAGAPQTRPYIGSVVYDPPRDRLLLVGGYAFQGMQTWALTLSGVPTWQILGTTGAPPARYGHSTIYDPIHDSVVMFGGNDDSYPSNYLSEVWSLSLASGTWSQLSPSGAAPPGREGHGAIYDPAGQRMIVFGGHCECGTRVLRNDTWQLNLVGPPVWSELVTTGPLPGARSAFGTVYDPVRHRMLVHGGINDQSGVEPDNLWALSLDGTQAWTQIVTEDTLHGRSYPVDVYDPDSDRLVACGGGGLPQTSELSLSAPIRWNAVLPPVPLPSPGPRRDHAVVRDIRRDRFLVVGGQFSPVDSTRWGFDPEGPSHWMPTRAPNAPQIWFDFDYPNATVYDSLGDRIIMFDGSQAWSSPAVNAKEWSPLGPRVSSVGLGPATVALGAAVALDVRRNRLIVSGGWVPYPHSAGFSQNGVWALSLGSDPTWSLLGVLPQVSTAHVAYYDPMRDRLIVFGGFQVNDLPRSHHSLGAVTWSTPLDSTLQWTEFRSPTVPWPPAPPDAHVAFDAGQARLFVATDSTLWTRGAYETGPWTQFEFTSPGPVTSSAIAYDATRDQVLALFAPSAGSTDVQAWAVAVGPLSVSLLAAKRSDDAITLDWRSVTAIGHVTTVERQEEGFEWEALGPLDFGSDGLARFTDHGIRPAHDYRYRVSVVDGASVWLSDPILAADPSSLQLALFGARPNPARGSAVVAFSLPSAAPTRLEVFDIRGRRCLSRDVGSFGPGRHSLRLDGSNSWRPGVYYVQLKSANGAHTTKFVLMK